MESKEISGDDFDKDNKINELDCGLENKLDSNLPNNIDSNHKNDDSALYDLAGKGILDTDSDQKYATERTIDKLADMPLKDTGCVKDESNSVHIEDSKFQTDAFTEDKSNVVLPKELVSSESAVSNPNETSNSISDNILSVKNNELPKPIDNDKVNFSSNDSEEKGLPKSPLTQNDLHYKSDNRLSINLSNPVVRVTDISPSREKILKLSSASSTQSGSKGETSSGNEHKNVSLARSPSPNQSVNNSDSSLPSQDQTLKTENNDIDMKSDSNDTVENVDSKFDVNVAKEGVKAENDESTHDPTSEDNAVLDTEKITTNRDGTEETLMNATDTRSANDVPDSQSSDNSTSGLTNGIKETATSNITTLPEVPVKKKRGRPKKHVPVEKEDSSKQLTSPILTNGFKEEPGSTAEVVSGDVPMKDISKVDNEQEAKEKSDDTFVYENDLIKPKVDHLTSGDAELMAVTADLFKATQSNINSMFMGLDDDDDETSLLTGISDEHFVNRVSQSPNFAVIFSFCEMFGSFLDLPYVALDDLEQSIESTKDLAKKGEVL